jgi:hypothetical protein
MKESLLSKEDFILPPELSLPPTNVYAKIAIETDDYWVR